MTTPKRILTLILAGLILLSSAACSDSGTNSESTADVSGASELPTETEETVPEETGPKPDLPDKTYSGEEVKFLTVLHTGYDWYTSHEIYAEEMNG